MSTFQIGWRPRYATVAYAVKEGRMAGWENSDRRSRLPSNWGTLVKEVHRRDGGRCTWRLPSGKRCPRKGTDVDHRRNNDDHSLSNLQLLCVDHHKQKTAMEARAGRRPRRLKRPPEAHPRPGPGTMI